MLTRIVMPVMMSPRIRTVAKVGARVGIVTAGLLVVGIMVWQGITSGGAPQTDAEGLSHAAVVLNTGILVFREGLEAILVLAALTASLVRTREGFWKPVALGAGLSFLASIATWFIVVAIISGISAGTNASALNIQAATGLLAIVVLLVIMNWFFHKVYWTGWITLHNRRKRNLTETANLSSQAIFRGLILLGFTSVYREGFEVVLFLQSLRLKAGTPVVLQGVLIGLGLTLIVALLTFVVHYRLPYRKMLILTGVMLGVVLLVMVGEEVQEMQLAGWLSVTNVNVSLPAWMNTWFAIGPPDPDAALKYPTAQGLISQGVAGLLVVGSYFLARHFRRRVKGDAELPTEIPTA